jgi:hypothetical protein
LANTARCSPLSASHVEHAIETTLDAQILERGLRLPDDRCSADTEHHSASRREPQLLRVLRVLLKGPVACEPAQGLERIGRFLGVGLLRAGEQDDEEKERR